LSAIVARPRDLRVALPLVRWGSLVGILIVELLGLSLCFDASTVAQGGRWWAQMVGKCGQLLHLAIAVAVATAVVRGPKLRGQFGECEDLFGPSRRWWILLLGHLATFAAFVAITAVILGGDPRSLIRVPGGAAVGGGPAIAPGWFLAWTVAGLATLALWCAAVLPPRSWIPLGRVAGGAILIGIVVGSLGWIAGHLTNLLWGPLCLGTFSAVAGMLRLIGLEVVSRPDRFVIGTPSFRVLIAPQCSGYEGIGLIWVFLGAYLWVFRRDLRFPRAFLLLPIGTVVIWLANSGRIAALVVLGTFGSRAVALGGFHSQAGWLVFNFVGLGLVVGSHRSRFFRPGAKPYPEETGANPAAAYLGPMLTLLATMMVTGAFSAGFDRLYPLRVLAATVVLWHYRREYTDLRRTWSWEATAVGIAVFALWMALDLPPTATEPATPWPAGRARGWAAVWLAFRVVGSVAVVPIAEELAFRSFLIRRLIGSDFTDVPPGRFTWGSFVISSLLFGALHGRWLAGTLAGLFYAVALYRRRELSDSVVAHATTNALIAAYILATGSWSMWN
jgi:exosortase E/protease (VPEID-CTERM system)